MPVSARRAALEALTACRKQGARPETYLAHHGPEDPREYALAVHIVNGVLQNGTYLDHAAAAYARDFRKLQPVVKDILRLSAYQIFFLDRVPARAAVNEGVELAKEYAPHAAGAVNAILRRLGESGGNVEIKAGSREEFLSVRYSHPIWLVRELIREYGDEACEKILAADNETPPITIQINTLKTTAGKLKASLNGSGVEVGPCPLLEDALHITGTGDVEKLEAFREGLFYVQDAAAHLAVAVSGVKAGDTVMDMCAAPGGKSFAAAIFMKNRGKIFSCDIHEKKTALIQKGAERLGISIIEAAPGDARVLRPGMKESADVVLCDVPCSGYGVIRKKPEIRYKDPAELTRLPDIQLDILRCSASYVKPGGTLVYSTCTVLRRENEDVVSAFLKERSDFEPVPFILPGPFGECRGMKTILPFEGHTDGFFICVLRKK